MSSLGNLRQTGTYLPMKLDIDSAYKILEPIVKKTPLEYHSRLSDLYGAKVFIKREDLQVVRSYKIRGAYHMIQSLPMETRSHGVVCASAGNHAQGVAYSCNLLKLYGKIYMPEVTPKQKINQVRMFGGEFIEIRLVGDTFDECQKEAIGYANTNKMSFIPPFDHSKIMEGQGTVAKEILFELDGIDYLFLPIGGGGLCAGVGTYFKNHSPQTKIIGAEPMGAPSMKEAFKSGKPIVLEKIDKFVDGAAVKKVGEFTFPICQSVLNDLCLVPEGKVCTTILNLYNLDAIVSEPAGALSIAALDDYKESIRGKTVVCILSGGNNDIDRMQEIKERSLLYEGLKQYFIVRFAQKPGALKQFVNEILGPNDDIVRFEFIQKNNKESGPALIGIELKSKDDFQNLLTRMQEFRLNFTLINQDENLFEYLI